jgi:DNA-binding NtrC family response regulator
MQMPAPVEISEFLGMPAVFASESMHRAVELARRVAQTDASILILGESGSGKEVVARAVHHYSARCSQPWVDISCAALPEHLVESELFGYERGAFSGAQSRKPGMFELADKGTLFLDEVGELELRLQGKLLRVLDNGEYYRLGGTRKVKVDVRVVGATNKDLRLEVEAGRFRSDLYHRLAQVKIEVPALRHRPEDVLPIAEFFLQKYRPGAGFSDEVKQSFLRYDWPGNVRQLRNVVMASVALSAGSEIHLESVPPELNIDQSTRSLGNLLQMTRAGINGGGTSTQAERHGVLESLEHDSILRVLAETKGHQGKAARILGISERTLHRKLKQYRQTQGKNPRRRKSGPPPGGSIDDVKSGLDGRSENAGPDHDR